MDIGVWSKNRLSSLFKRAADYIHSRNPDAEQWADLEMADQLAAKQKIDWFVDSKGGVTPKMPHNDNDPSFVFGGNSKLNSENDLKTESEEEKARRKAAEEARKGDRENSRDLKKRNLWGALRHNWYAIHDYDDYLRIYPQQPAGGFSKQISDKQLREIIMKCVLEKGWDTLYFYKGNKVDTNTASRATSIIRELTRPASSICKEGPLYKINAQWTAEKRPLHAEYVRMEPEHLPSDFNRALHERMMKREKNAMDRGFRRSQRKELFANLGYA